ncbi:MAG: hypothetical protein J3K34DRAFT_518161 [Monoraphidium minutum]|nr:MAG: hypothetical protein J3K34DRAFT_518161 [Monoraphidium minutum]
MWPIVHLGPGACRRASPGAAAACSTAGAAAARDPWPMPGGPRPLAARHAQRGGGRAPRAVGASASGAGEAERGQQQARRDREPREQQQQGAWSPQQQPRPPLQQQVLTVSPGSDLARTARALIQQLDAFGAAELWCTGVSSQVYGVGVLVTAQEMLASRGAGLAATLQQAAPDGEPDHEKRSIRKLVIGAVPAPPPRPGDWAGADDRTSTAVVRGPAELAGALRGGLAGPRRGHALEARGEQGVNRALRAVLALQSELGAPLAVWPWYGAVADAGAAARGEGPRSVPGTVLLVRRCDEDAQQ